jgi:hypothetical protein
LVRDKEVTPSVQQEFYYTPFCDFPRIQHACFAKIAVPAQPLVAYRFSAQYLKTLIFRLSDGLECRICWEIIASSSL